MSVASACAVRCDLTRSLPDLVRLTVVGGARGRVQSFTGVIVARVESSLGFRVSGKVTQRLVDEGQTVRKGQPLMRIDVTDYTHAISAQTENVAAARARAEQAVADEARYRGLVATGAVSASTYALGRGPSVPEVRFEALKARPHTSLGRRPRFLSLSKIKGKGPYYKAAASAR